MTVLHEALEQGRLDTVRRLGHSMMGCGGGYGFYVITEIGAKLEQAAKGGDADAIRTQVERLARYLANVEVVHD